MCAILHATSSMASMSIEDWSCHTRTGCRTPRTNMMDNAAGGMPETQLSAGIPAAARVFSAASMLVNGGGGKLKLKLSLAAKLLAWQERYLGRFS